MKKALYLSWFLCLVLAIVTVLGYCAATRLTPEIRAKTYLKRVELGIHVYYQKHKKLPKNLNEVLEHPDQEMEDYLKKALEGEISYEISDGKIKLQSETDKTFIREIPLEDIYNNSHSLTAEAVEDYYRDFKQ